MKDYIITFIVYRKNKIEFIEGCYKEAEGIKSVDEFISDTKNKYLKKSNVIKVEVQKQLGGC